MDNSAAAAQAAASATKAPRPVPFEDPANAALVGSGPSTLPDRSSLSFLLGGSGPSTLFGAGPFELHGGSGPSALLSRSDPSTRLVGSGPSAVLATENRPLSFLMSHGGRPLSFLKDIPSNTGDILNLLSSQSVVGTYGDLERDEHMSSPAVLSLHLQDSFTPK